MGVRAERHQLAAKFAVAAQSVRFGQKVKPRPFGVAVEFESFALCDQLAQYLVEQVGVVGVAHHFVLIRSLADHIADVSDDVVVVRRVHARGHVLKIFGVRFAPGALVEEGRKVAVLARHEVDGVDDDVRLVLLVYLDVERVGGGKPAVFYPDGDVEFAAVFVAQAHDFFKAARQVDLTDIFVAGQDLAVLVAMVGDRKIGQPFGERTLDHIARRSRAVVGKVAMGVAIDDLFHAYSLQLRRGGCQSYAGAR